MNIIILMGGPGAGKGTQAQALAAWLRMPHISTGDLLRSEAAQQSELGLRATAAMETGGLVSDEVVGSLVGQRIGHDDCRLGFILDGYPRTVHQAAMLRPMVGEGDRLIVFDIDVSVDWALARLASRRRWDDQEDVIRKRFRVHESEGAPLRELYGKWNVYRRIDGMRTVEDVARDVRSVVESELTAGGRGEHRTRPFCCNDDAAGIRLF